ncbi:hypothetical protein OIE73_31920 [Streptomyces hirsutus]|uniref:Uncharacterized protein n=1 Tax=Streptomyces hirsutus TaxID=35620 RepID=A0ABZ1GUK3_9ACTN|nr:hypothetical protein [Streptomyces hirsutus]WSD09882.1 hypothetical protein OIE73_31920 [Streptomyces hirsutus]
MTTPYRKEVIPLFTVSYIHHSARRTGEYLSSLLDSATLHGVDFRLISADAHQGRGAARWLDVELHATKEHGYPHADTAEALGAVELTLDSVIGHEVQGFGSVAGGFLTDAHAILEGLALSLRLSVQADTLGLPDSHFALDSRDRAT